MGKKYVDDVTGFTLEEGRVDITFKPDYGSEGPADKECIHCVRFIAEYYERGYSWKSLSVRFRDEDGRLGFSAIVHKPTDSKRIWLGGDLGFLKIESLRRLQAVDKKDMGDILKGLGKLRPDAKSFLEKALAIDVDGKKKL